MRIERTQIQAIQVRHVAFDEQLAGDHVVWWYGAVVRNHRALALPHVVVFLKKLLPDGTLYGDVRRKVGISELGLLQIGTIWNDGRCNRRLELQERTFSVDFSRGRWRFTSQSENGQGADGKIFPLAKYPLPLGEKDRTQLLVLDLDSGGTVMVPTLEFYSRYYGRSGYVQRVLAAYPWSEVEKRFYLPVEHSGARDDWPIKLNSKVYNDDAEFLAHVRYDTYAQDAARRVHTGLNHQYGIRSGIAFPMIYPWFAGPATLIVQGHWTAENQFLALRIEGGSYPAGPPIHVYRETPGKASEQAPRDAPESSWNGARFRRSDSEPPTANLTADDEPDHDGNTVELLSTSFRLVGPRREVVRHHLDIAATTPGQGRLAEAVDLYSSGDRFGSARGVGQASIHSEIILESFGATRDVWNALQFLRVQYPDQVLSVGWYSAELGAVQVECEPSMVTLWPFDAEREHEIDTLTRHWVFTDRTRSRLRGVLVCHVETPARRVFLFEVERRKALQAGAGHDEAEHFSGLVVPGPTHLPLNAWIFRILDGIRREKGIMKRVIDRCPDLLAYDYRRSNSKGDQVAAQSTVINALSKVGIEVRRPRI